MSFPVRDDILVLTYNICFGCMTNNPSTNITGSAIAKQCSGEDGELCFNNLRKTLENIKTGRNGRQFDFIGLQEASRFKLIAKFQVLNNMNYVHTHSGREESVIFYNPTRFKLPRYIGLFVSSLNDETRDKLFTDNDRNHKKYDFYPYQPTYIGGRTDFLKQPRTNNNGRYRLSRFVTETINSNMESESMNNSIFTKKNKFSNKSNINDISIHEPKNRSKISFQPVKPRKITHRQIIRPDMNTIIEERTNEIRSSNGKVNTITRRLIKRGLNGYEPEYNPSIWNHSTYKSYNNCYAYAVGKLFKYGILLHALLLSRPM